MSRLINYIRDTKGEMKHVSWPTRQQAIVYTLLVVAVSAFVALFIAAFDFLFGEGLNLLINNF